MRDDLPAPGSADAVLDRRSLVVTLYRTGGPAGVILGTATDPLDLTPYVSRLTHTHEDVSLSIAHGGELTGDARPKPGHVVSITLGGYVVFAAVVDNLSGEVESRGERLFQIKARRRDAFPWWRDVRRMTEVYGIGADLGILAEDVARNLGLADEEFEIGNVGVSQPHDTAQIADVNGWEMLRILLEPALLEPFVDARGVLKAISRNVRRPPDLVLSAAEVVRIESSTSRPPVTGVRVTWLDPGLTRVEQGDQLLGQAQMVCSFFSMTPSVDVWFSEGQDLRATNTRMQVRQSVNSPSALFGIHVGTESYSASSEYGGTVSCALNPAVPVVTALALAGLVAAAWIPDGVETSGLIESVGVTIPWGRAAQQVALNVVLLGIMVQGQHFSEIWGTPYDFVHVENETEAYDQAAPEWLSNVVDIRCDLIPDEARARGLAVNELCYLARSANHDSLVIRDDPRVEPGDILEVPSGRSFFVTGYERDLTRGAEPVLSLDGFFL